MRRVITLLGAWLFLVTLPDAAAQTAPPQPRFVTVRSLRLDGLDSLPEPVISVLRERITAHKYLKAKLLEHSTARFRQVLYSYGYVEAVVHPPSIKNVEENLVDLSFEAEPGTRYYISGLALGGVQAFSPQQVRDLIPIHPGDPVDNDKVKQAVSDIRQLYHCSGYLDADPVFTDNYHRATHTLFYNVQMQEGKIFRIANVKVVGLEPGLVDKVITLPELQPRGVFSSCEIRAAINALWPHKDPASEFSFAVRAHVIAPESVAVVIDFFPGHLPRDEVQILTKPSSLLTQSEPRQKKTPE